MIIFFIGVWRNLRAYISIRGHRLQMSVVGTLTNDDVDGSGNVAKKMNLRSFKLNQVYLDPLNMLMQETFPEDEFFYSSSKRGRKIRRRMSTSSIKRKFRRLHVIVVQWTSTKCTKKRDACAELLFWSLNLLFFEVVVVVVVVVA